jgi:peptide/nickel transport system substrate-binding protein
MMRHGRTRFAAFLLGTALSAGFAITARADEKIFRMPYFADVGSFDPDNAFEVGGLGAVNGIYEGLVEYKPGTTEIVGLLADSWEVSEDQLTYTFHLADGVTFHDGTPMDAAAVKTSLERRKNGELTLSYFLWNVTAIETPDDKTVVLTLGQPQPSFLDALASPWGPKVISPKALADNAGTDNATGWLNDNAVGTGPFMLTSFNRGEEIVLDRYDAYHGAAPYFDEVQLPIVPDIGQQILQLQSGDIDAVPNNYPWNQLAALPPGLAITAAPSMALVEAAFKTGTALDDPAIRAAVLTAMNPATWAAQAYGGYATPALSVYQAVMLTPKTPIVFPTDMAAAKAAIEKAGGLALTIGVPADEQPNVGTAVDLMVALMAEIGITATINVLPQGAVYSVGEDLASAPDILISRMNPDAAHPENQATVFYTAEAPLNFLKASVPEADALVMEAGTKTDVAERDALYEKAGQLYFDAGAFIPLVDIEDVVVHKEGLVDLGLRPVFPPGNIDFATVRWAE